MAELRVELNITVRDKPFVSDTEIFLWLNRHLTDHAPESLVQIDSIRLVGPRR